jgi:hypothetical protein
MSEGAFFRTRRYVWCLEDPIYTAGSFQTPYLGYEDSQGTAGYNLLPDNRQLTTRLGVKAGHLGEKQATFTFTRPLHNAFCSTNGEALALMLEAALGSDADGSALTFSSASTNATGTVSAGTFAPIVETVLTKTDNPTIRRRVPVKSVAGGTVATWAIKPTLPSGYAVTDINNPDQTGSSATGGKCFKEDPTATSYTFQFEIDQDGENDSVPWILKGMAINELTVLYDLQERLRLRFGFEGGDWSQESGSNLADASSEPSGNFLSWAASCFIQDLTTPAEGTQVEITNLELNLASQMIPRRATRQNTGATPLVPGSAICGYKRGLSLGDGTLKVTVSKASTAWITALTNRTPYQFFVDFTMGGPSATATGAAVAIWCPRVVLESVEEVENEGLTGQALTFRIEDSGLASADGLLSKCFFAVFGA